MRISQFPPLAFQHLQGVFCPRCGNCFPTEEIKVFNNGGELRTGKAKKSFIRAYISGVAASVATIAEIQAIFQIWNDGCIYTGGL